MEEKVNVLRAKFSALSKEKAEGVKRKNECEARVAELSTLLLSAKKENHDLKVNKYPMYEKELIKAQSVVKSEKIKTETLMKNRQKVERLVEKERRRREEERKEEEIAVLEYGEKLQKITEGMKELWQEQSILTTKWGFEIPPSDLLSRIEKYLNETESWDEICGLVEKLRGMREDWEGYVEERDTINVECKRIYGLLFKLLEEMEHHERGLEEHGRGPSGVVATPAEGLVEFKVALSSIRETVSAITRNNDFPDVDLRACVVDGDYAIVINKYLPSHSVVADERKKRKVELDREEGSGEGEGDGNKENVGCCNAK
ncbi:hypothetical protein TrRE_jg13005 [Triparma retinervis]|uniref:Uncharacterized protein n=1 Tax=Triparma retinervis TaxID=2557542 RepID=A0A9W7ANU4_9STRA|nr:hypothetical protein TrRE_jg13005 [Triparma retinervis]